MILTTALIFIGALCNSVMDKISFHHSKSVFKNMSDWWNPQKSWKFKWKNGDPKQGEKFWLSSTWLVWTTDAWHLFKSLMEMSLLVAVVTYSPTYYILLDLAIIFGIQAATFHTFFTYIFNKK